MITLFILDREGILRKRKKHLAHFNEYSSYQGSMGSSGGIGGGGSGSKLLYWKVVSFNCIGHFSQSAPSCITENVNIHYLCTLSGYRTKVVLFKIWMQLHKSLHNMYWFPNHSKNHTLPFVLDTKWEKSHFSGWPLSSGDKRSCPIFTNMVSKYLNFKVRSHKKVLWQKVWWYSLQNNLCVCVCVCVGGGGGGG